MYLSVTNVENRVGQAAGGPNAAFTSLITLPHKTWENRTCRAVKIAGGTGTERIGVYFVGGLHAREWGSCDILVRLIDDLTKAYKMGQGISYGAKSFTVAQVKDIVEKLNLYVFPQANPDGRHYSMTQVAMWRKNRRPAGPNDPVCTDPKPDDFGPGVDVNRNFDFLWNFPQYFVNGGQNLVASSTDNCASTYIGPAPESEPETKNIASIVDAHPEIRFFVDVHSYLQLILYGWGDDEHQTADPSMNFANPAYDGQRGVTNDAYKEYIQAPVADLQQTLSNRMRDAIVAAGGPAYTVKPSIGLYPTSGTTTERFFMRNFVDRGKGRVHSWTIEWGMEFQPPWSTMSQIVEHICAALLDLCLGVVQTHSDLYIKDNAADAGTVPSAGVFWESPELIVRNSDDNVFTHQDPKAGQDNFVYVRVTNRGPNTSRPMTVTVRAVPFAGTEFVYPADWTAADATHVVPAPIQDTFDGVPQGQTRIAKFKLTEAQVGQLGNWKANGWHPCLLAEVDCVSDYGSRTGNHVWQDNNLAQRNVSVIPAAAGAKLSWAFLVGSKFTVDRELTLDLELIGVPRDSVVTLDLGDELSRFPAVRESIEMVQEEPAFAGKVRGRTQAESRGTEPDRTHGKPADRPSLRLREPKTKLRVSRKPHEPVQAVVTFEVPKDARPGDVYRIRAAQRDATGQVVGGVTLEIPVS